LAGCFSTPGQYASHRVPRSSRVLPTDPSQPTAVRRLLSWASGPFSTCRNRRSTCRELAGLTPLRLQGLVTLLTAYSLRNLVGSVSHRQHSWDSPFGVCSSCRVFGVFPHRIDPPAVSPAVVPGCRSTGPARQTAAPGSCPEQKARANTDGFSIGPAGKLPWGFPFQGMPRRP
jgi:hypothetical protein